MRREVGWENLRHDPRSVVTVGVFDGVHIGHQAVLAYVRERAQRLQGPSTVVTFDPHPREVIYGEPVPILTTPEEKLEIMEALGMDRVVILPFTRELAAMEPEAFVREVLIGRVGMQEIVVGYDHHFGRGRKGDVELLRRLGKELGFTVDVIPPHRINHLIVSSSHIRKLLLEKGDVEEAARLLGRPYSLYARVVRGSGRGRALGFPTANLEVDHPRKIVPYRGVYAVEVWLPEEGIRYGGMMNIGQRPTFGETARTVLEVHLLDFEGDLYGRRLRVAFLARLRDEQKFDSVEALRRQLEEDRRRTMEILMTHTSS